MVFEAIRRHELGDLLGNGRPDAGNRLEGLETASGVDSTEGSVEGLDHVCRPLVGPRLEGNVIHIQIDGDLTKDAGDLAVRHEWQRV